MLTITPFSSLTDACVRACVRACACVRAALRLALLKQECLEAFSQYCAMLVRHLVESIMYGGIIIHLIAEPSTAL